MKPRTYNTSYYLHRGYHGNTRKAGFIHWGRGATDQVGKKVCLLGSNEEKER